VAGDRLLVTSLLPECDASHAGSRASVLYAAPPPPPLPAIPGLPRRHFIHPARYLDFLDLPALRIRLVDSSPGHLGSLLSGPANSSNVQTCLYLPSLYHSCHCGFRVNYNVFLVVLKVRREPVSIMARLHIPLLFRNRIRIPG